MKKFLEWGHACGINKNLKFQLPERRKTCFATEKEHERDDSRTRKGLQDKVWWRFWDPREPFGNDGDSSILSSLYNWDVNLYPSHNRNLQNFSMSVIVLENKNIENSSKNSVRKENQLDHPLPPQKNSWRYKFSF